MKKLLTVFLSALICASVSATEYHVSPNGNDHHLGSSKKPFKTIQKAVDVMKPGDVIYIGAGTYRESVLIRRTGIEGAEIKILAEPGTVIMDGRENIYSEWMLHKGHIYKTKIKGPVEQVFVGNQMMVEARWPNMSFPDDLWDRSSWSASDDGSTRGKMIDTGIAETNINWTGALATLNVSHQWWTWTSEVTEHSAGAASFTYRTDNMSGMYEETDYYNYNDDFYYLSGKLEALDVEGEWFYDDAEGYLYVYIPGGRKPQKGILSVKRRDYAFAVQNAEYLCISGIDYFACTISLDDCNHCTIEKSRLSYPAYSRKIMERYTNGGMSPCTSIKGDSNIFRECELSFSSGSGLQVEGSYNLIENNIIHDVCWSGSLNYNALRIAAPQGAEVAANWVRLNTLYNAGNTILHLNGRSNIAELNHVFAGGRLCQDVSLIYTLLPTCEGTEIKYNWVHDVYTPHIALGIRGDDKTRRLSVHHNVVWNIGWDGIVVKGDENKVFNNTGFNGDYSDILIQNGPETVKDWHSQYPSLPVRNAHSLTCNNLVETLSGNRWNDTPPEGELSNNLEYKDLTSLLVNASAFDFRPLVTDVLVDKGRIVTGDVEYEGELPDIGAYEHAAVNYWIPGHQEELASFPIPSDRGSLSSEKVDLIWKEARLADSYHIYFGTNPEMVKEANEESDCFIGKQDNNIFSPGDLEPGNDYFWRVDAVSGEGVRKGKVWSFSLTR